MSRLPRLVRLLHTGGRQTPYPNQGGAGLASTIPPSMSTTVPPHSSVPSPSPTTLPPPTPTITSSDTSLEPIESIVPTELSTPRPPAPPEFTAKGRLIPRRPRRTVPVTLPSGHPEPPSYPPPPTYFQQVENLLDIKPHPLWQFFHPTSAAKSMLSKEIASPPAGGFGSVETVDSNPDVLLRSGRAWKTEELRNKSFADLHTLWYVLLKERNVLVTQEAERRRLQIPSYMDQELISERKRRCRRSTARIKFVLNERRLGLIAAAGPSMPAPMGGVPRWMDPVRTHEAIRGIAALPELVRSVLEDGTEARLQRPGKKRASRESVSMLEEEGEGEAVVGDEDVAKEEVESRDEGWGGGDEAREFVQEMEVEDGTVRKKE